MAKLILFNMVTPEGYFAAADGSLGWHCVDAEFNAFAIQQLRQSSALLFGRKTFEMMQACWNAPDAFENDPVVCDLMRNTMKYVVSKSFQVSEWENTAFLNRNLLDEILQLKATSEKDVLIFGSAELSRNFFGLGLIDEYRLMVNPVLLGYGKPLFKNIENQIGLRFVDSQVFESGNVLLRYTPVDQEYLHL